MTLERWPARDKTRSCLMSVVANSAGMHSSLGCTPSITLGLSEGGKRGEEREERME